jgi:maltose alpha-D-glucosyltransferase / alpha-amylase
VPSRGSAWERALDHVQGYCERAMIQQRRRAERGESGTPQPREVEELIGAYRATIELLGRRTADLHRTLAALEGDGFGVEPFDHTALGLMAREVSAQVDRVLALLREADEVLPRSAQQAGARLAELKPEILARVEQLRGLQAGGLRVRVHGDFHLGQVLEVDGDVYFIDFEGEPARAIAERRRPQSPLRDVAGMLRSFGYAARAGFREFQRRHPDSRLPLDAWIRGWESETSGLYLRSYFRHMGEGAVLPAAEARGALLEAFLLEKGLYELAYELGNRPDWIDIPLTGLLQLLDPEWTANEDYRGGLQGAPA